MYTPLSCWLLRSFSCWRRWGRESLTLLPGSFRSPGEDSLPGRSMSRWERRVSYKGRSARYCSSWSTCFDLKCLSIVVTQPQTSSTTPKSGGRIASTETLLETTSAWSRSLNCDSSWPRGSELTLLIQLTSLIADLRWNFLCLDSWNSTKKEVIVVKKNVLPLLRTFFFSFRPLLTVLISSFCFSHDPVYQERFDLDP